MHDLVDPREDGLEGERVPHGQRHAALRRQPDERLGLFERARHGALEQHGDARLEHDLRDAGALVLRGAHHHGVGADLLEQALDAGEGGHREAHAAQRGAGGGARVGHRDQLAARDVREHDRVRDPGAAEADDGHALDVLERDARRDLRLAQP